MAILFESTTKEMICKMTLHTTNVRHITVVKAFGRACCGSGCCGVRVEVEVGVGVGVGRIYDATAEQELARLWVGHRVELCQQGHTCSQ